MKQAGIISCCVQSWRSGADFVVVCLRRGEMGSKEERNVLRAIACRHGGDAARPLFGVGSTDDCYVLDSPESLWPDAQHRKDVMLYLSTL